MVGGVGFSQVAAEAVFDLVQAGLDVGRGALQEGFDRAVGAVPDIAGQVIATGRTLSGIPKSDPLHPAFENDLFGDFVHGAILESLL